MFTKYNLHLWLYRHTESGKDLFQVTKQSVSISNIFKTIRFYKKNYGINQITIYEDKFYELN